ncbi:MAG: 3-isopropylmalate dehydratase small subunit [Sphingobium sp.]
MEKLTQILSVAAPVHADNIDTDIIFPGRFLLITDRDGLGRYAFYDWRFDGEGQERDFILGRAPWQGAQILVTGENFGCGSSREQAAWALRGAGIRCVIAPSFGEIFYGNCFNNGILPVRIDADSHAALMAEAEAGRTLTAHVASGEIIANDGRRFPFPLDQRRRDALLNGWDEIDAIRAANGPDIHDFEQAQRMAQPWLWTPYKETL